MTTLLLSLPLAPPAGAPEYDYAALRDDGSVSSSGRAAVSLLPARAGRAAEVVAVLPARALSWHALVLPPRVAASLLATRADPVRARAVLAGALEDRVLDEVDRLHFAVFAGAGVDAALWVAVCERAWLQGALQTLESAGLTVARAVAECGPLMALDAANGLTARAYVTDGMEPAQVALSTAAGVTLLPLGEAAIGQARAHSALELLAEPSVMGLAEQAFGQPARAQTGAQRLADAARSPWNLAQLEFSPSRSGRAAKRLGSVWARLRHDPQWRPVRWGLLAVLLGQIVALNAVAYRHNAQLDAKRSAIKTVLSQTFPNVPVIVDAPVQMQREVQALARTRGESADGTEGGADLARLLSAASDVLGADRPVSAVDYAAGELRLRVAGVLESDADNLAAALGDAAWTVQAQGDQLTLQRRGAN